MTRQKKICPWVILGLLISVVYMLTGSFGCQKPTGQSDSKGVDVPRLVSGRLPELGDYLPPLDEGRLELAPPKDWTVSPRSTRYIIRFQADSGSTYPSVLVVGTTSDRFKTVTAENLEAFAKSVAAELQSAGTNTTVKMGRIGNLIGVTYSRRAKVKDDFGGIVERLFFDTVVAGRRYQFELRCPPEMVGLAEPYFFAIVNGAKIASVAELEEEGLAEGGSAAAEKAKPQPQAEEKPPAKAPVTAEKPKTEAPKAEAKPAEKPAGQAAQKPAPQTAESSPASKKEEKPSQQPPAEKPKEPEKPAPKAEPPKEAAPETKPEEKPKGKKTEDVLKDVDALLQ